jgi:L-2-hydroxyglutarate oxidase LhgO
MDHIDSCVIGAGVVGLAVARKLAEAGREVVVLDREGEFGQGVSSRNSEVIHAGIYYPEGSLKALMCVAGKHKLYDYCESRGVGHQRCGKLIVATEPEEEDVLAGIIAKAEANGVDDLEYWDTARLRREEPNVKATRALFSPSTGIVSSHELMQAYIGDIDTHGGMFVGHTEVLGADYQDGLFILNCRSQGSDYQFSSRTLVNAAALGAQQVAAGFSFIDQATVPPLYYCKGNYYTLSGNSPFNHLIYPVPEKSGAGLGVHATIDLGGQVKFGPDVEYIDEEDYNVATDREADYYEAVRRYFPALADGELTPGYVGIRPKLQGPGDPVEDFVIQDQSVHGVLQLIQLYGIESPGLTSSLAIADEVFRRLQD